MAFTGTGYVFTSKEHIKPYLEHAETGPSVEWAKTQAKRLSAHVQVGYPEKRISDKAGQPHEEFYNSVCFVSPDGKVLATYAKHFLYYTDENWAEEGPAFQSMSVQGLGQVGFGICMDVNPYKFQAPFTDFEFSSFHLSQKSNLMLCSMAWNKGEKTKVERGHKPETSKAESAETVDVNSDGDDDDDDNWEDEEDAESLQYETVQYWAVRMSPFYRQEQKPLHETIMVIANRIGSESGELSLVDIGHRVNA
ncbi:Carbon-nitrogen hydrolase [Mortierella sp. GBA30]|nr:Carbon-nitrogen hydrolase [Mortierella sp. GBA30]